ncbi:exopolyphosphatase [Fuchsiella alkaliacetigena]|uniref:exopolyphosphatase n=1 Tax=Fuchsiella alkaliacetigena TaxID=957042 RepID=UPI002009FD55|nr:exopolyphosphatase [Fuchsiella alkaliacetigena]MCK8823625.1 exopolyphosphatase [Fuchsiella alkaliacetigena]
MSEQKYRLVTRSDFDGLVSAVLLKEMDLIDDINFVHPKDVQDGKEDITDRDILTNLPYVEEAYLVFDHHSSELLRVGKEKENHIIDPEASSAARVVYNYYGGPEQFPNVSEEMMTAVDKADAAQFTKEDVLNPTGWELLSFMMDARTGLGRFRDFRISNYDLMMDLIDYCQELSIEEILELPDVKERVDLYFNYEDRFKEQLKECSEVHDNVLVLDFREEETIYPGNRFMKYVLYPETNISIHTIWGYQQQNTVFAVGKSIFNKSSEANIGEVMLEYGGGGHKAAGTCQIDNERADEVLEELIERFKD